MLRAIKKLEVLKRCPEGVIECRGHPLLHFVQRVPGREPSVVVIERLVGDDPLPYDVVESIPCVEAIERVVNARF